MFKVHGFMNEQSWHIRGRITILIGQLAPGKDPSVEGLLEGFNHSLGKELKPEAFWGSFSRLL